MGEEIKNIENSADIKVLYAKLDHIGTDISGIRSELNMLRGEFVTRREFEGELGPLRKICYGLVGTIGIIVLTTVIRMLLIN